MLFKEKLKVVLVLPVLSTLFVCCNMMDKVIRKETRLNYENKILFTGRHKNDTVSELLIIRENNYFEYIVSANPFTKKLTHGYGGRYENRNDSTFLYFYKNYQPPDLANYVIVDSADKIIVFPYADGVKKRYLKLTLLIN